MRSTDVDVVLDLMIHDLDLLLYLDGTEPVGVDAVGVAALTDKVDIANVRLRFRLGLCRQLDGEPDQRRTDATDPLFPIADLPLL